MNQPAESPPPWYETITVNIYYLGLTTLSQTNVVVFPLLVQRFVGETEKDAYLGVLRLWTLMTALLVQSLAGMLSDRSTLRWGRRRPFLVAGTLLSLVFLAGVGFSSEMEGLDGFWFLFAAAIAMQVSVNIAHGAQQGFIPDRATEADRVRYSGVKAVFELPLPLVLVAFTVGSFIKAGNLWGGLAAAGLILLVCLGLALFTRENPLTGPAPAIRWEPFLRLSLMTGLFTAIILAAGEAVKMTGRALAGAPSAWQIAAMGLIALLAMILAVAGGVWASIAVGVGAAVRSIPSFPWWVVNRLAFLVGVINLSTFAVFYFQARLGMNSEQAAQPAFLLMLFVGLFLMAAALTSARLSAMVGGQRLVGWSGALAALGVVIVLITPSLPVIYLGGGVIGLAAGYFFSANWALGVQIIPKEEAGRFLGIANLAGAGAGAVGAYIGGPMVSQIKEMLPATPQAGYLVLFVIYGLLFLLSIAALRGVKTGFRADGA